MAFASILIANGILVAAVLAVLLALALFVSGVIVSIVFAVGKKKRAAQGKNLGGKIAIPVVLFILSGMIAVPLCIGGVAMKGDSDSREAVQAADKEVFHAETVDDLAAAIDSYPEIAVDEYENKDSEGYGESLLQNAIRFNDAEKVDLLLSRGADPNKGSVPPLECALKADAGTPGADSFFGESDLEEGRDAYNPRIVLALLDAGANPNYSSQSSQYLSWLIKDMFGNGIDEADVGVVHSMILHGAGKTAQDGNGMYPFEVFLDLAEIHPAKDLSQSQLYDAIQLLLQ